MIVSIIVAMDRRGGIGKDNRLPWRLSSDLKRFKELTMGHHVILGRKTFESIGRPLPGRKMIVLTRNPQYKPEGCIVAGSVDEALEIAGSAGETEAFVCGGSEIYRSALPLADRIYLTAIDAEVQADTFFPNFDRSDWLAKQAGRQEADEKNQYSFSFIELDRSRDRR